MLSPHTLPGTKVVCINAIDCEGYLREGDVYTVRQIIMGINGNRASPGFETEVMPAVQLEEIAIAMMPDGTPYTAWGLRRFRKLELPKCLTDMVIPEMV